MKEKPNPDLHGVSGGAAPPHSNEMGNAMSRSPERQRTLPGEEHNTCRELVADPVPQCGEMSETLASYGRGGLDLHTDYSTGWRLQHAVHLPAVAVLEVEHANLDVGGGSQLGQLVDDERFQ